MNATKDFDQRKHLLGDLLQCVAALTQAGYRLEGVRHIAPPDIASVLVEIKREIDETLKQVRGG